MRAGVTKGGEEEEEEDDDEEDEEEEGNGKIVAVGKAFGSSAPLFRQVLPLSPSIWARSFDRDEFLC